MKALHLERFNIILKFLFMFSKAKAQDVCVKLTEDYESRLQTVSFRCAVE